MNNFKIPLLAALAQFCACVATHASGLPNLSYPSSSPFDMLSRIDSSVGAPRGHGFVTMHQGYLMVISSNDGGGGKGSGGFSFLDISDPTSPSSVFVTDSTAPYNDSSSNQYAGNIREAHGYTFSGDIWCMTTNKTGASGLQFWDLSNISAPVRLSEIDLSTLTGGDYSPTAWWVSWQAGRYAYVASTTGGLHIVDATDPSNPVEVKRIATGDIGGFRVNTCFAIGNLLVVARSDGGGIATFDISDPANPVLLDRDTSAQVGYSMMVNGNKILGAHDPARVYDISDPTNITLEGTGPNVASKGGYGIFKNGHFHYGSSNAIVRLDISSLPYTSLGTASPSGFTNPDWDFSVPLGNLIFAGNDHSGSALLVGDTAPDTSTPEVNMVNPQDGSTNLALSSRVGITLTDQVQTDSIDNTTFIVRPIGGSALSGSYSNQTGIVNFWPDSPLAPDTTYEVIVTAGGIKNLVGSGVGTTFTSQFSTGSTIATVTLDASSTGTAETGTQATFSATSTGASNPEYSWDFGDGTPATAFSTSASINHTYTTAGNYSVSVTLRDGVTEYVKIFGQLIHKPLTANLPSQSSTIIFDEANNRIWVANPDNNTVTAIASSAPFNKLVEIPVDTHPRTLALGPSNELWVACQEADAINRINRSTGTVLPAINLDYGDAPFGIAFAPDGSTAYVTLEGAGELIRIDPTTRTLVGSPLSVGNNPRGIAVSADGARVLVTRFISPDTQGEVLDINTATFSLNATIGLALDPGPDNEDSGRGLPNYLSTIAISPDGCSAWIPSKKDNIQRGTGRDGLQLTFESTVRSIASKIDLTTGLEQLSSRVDFNDRDMASAVAYSKYGNYVFIATQGTQTVEIVDAYTSDHFGSIQTNGLSPQGLTVSPDGTTLFVHNFMSRAVAVFNISNMCNNVCGITPELANVSTVVSETLPTQTLEGKRIFYNAGDLRMSRDSYISCASCHLDGKYDGRTWDFTDRGEGFRNTPTLDGRSGTGHGRVHWSANFDEIQDFEHDIRGPFGGTGFMSDEDFNSGNRNRTLGGTKAGYSSELDAMSAYVSSLSTVEKSPFRNTDGSMTPSAIAGQAIFENRCATCHSGPDFTDSIYGVLRDVGTLGSNSGNRLGKTLPGIDTPGLRGVWSTPPYLHDGSAMTLHDVLVARNTSDLHGVTSDLSPAELQNLIDYLLQLDDSSTSFPLVAPPVDTDPDTDGMTTAYEEANDLDPYFDDASLDPDSDGSNNFDESINGTDPNNQDTDGDGLLDGVENDSGTYNGPTDPGTDPLDPDTDGDTFTDGEEIAGGSDPLDPLSTPGPVYTITMVSETNGQPEGLTATYLSGISFDEDVDAFTDRSHEWNGIDANGLPDFLVGQDYIQCANDSRGTTDYSLTVTLGRTAKLYLLLDNRVSPPVWMSDGMELDFIDTGIDVGWDEGGNATGPGASIDQTASVYIAQDTTNENTSSLAVGAYSMYERGGGGNNMYGIVAVPTDTDFDGMPDDFENANGLNPNLNDSGLDKDGEGLTNLEEFLLGTDVNMVDSDGDNYSDFEEVLAMSDPNDANSIPPAPPLNLVGMQIHTDRVEISVGGFDVNRTYRLRRSENLSFWQTIISGFTPSASTDTITDTDPPEDRAFYTVESE